MEITLKAPFPWFGGKSRAAHFVWQHFLAGGTPIDNYVEPFAGSLAILLGRPKSSINKRSLETINDFDGYVSNFWRATKEDPDQLAHHLDYPTSEIDLIARNNWLVENRARFKSDLLQDPNFFDAKVAAWWCYGQILWIGGGFAQNKVGKKLPALSSSKTAAGGIWRRDTRLGVTATDDLFEPGLAIRDRMRVLAERLRTVRVTCGDWTECLSPAVTVGNGITGIVLDPPYTTGEHAVTYAADAHQAKGRDIADEVRHFAIQNGKEPGVKVALCGYESDKHPMPEDWYVQDWIALGGFSSTAKVERKAIEFDPKTVFGLKTGAELAADSIVRTTQGKKNRMRERIWFSPSCFSSQDEMFGAFSHHEDVITV